MISFVIYGEPVAQQRPRSTTIHGYTRHYDPPKSKNYKHYVRMISKKYAPKHPLSTPISLSISIYRPIPKSWSQKKKRKATNKEILPTTKPDIDNYAKAIKDALSNLMWNDDRQVVALDAKKFYGETPRVEIIIKELN